MIIVKTNVPVFLDGAFLCDRMLRKNICNLKTYMNNYDSRKENTYKKDRSGTF